MNLKEYRETRGCKELYDLADRLGINRHYLYVISKGWRNASPKLALQIANETKGLVSPREVRPDIWA